jgi:pyridoxal phosphate enzyme (YggS family)
MDVTANLEHLKSLIRDCGRHPDEVTIVAVTKGFGEEAVLAATASGLVDLGENYAQELAAKHGSAPDARWHFIGRLQSNKVRLLAGQVDVWQSLDRPKLLTRVAEHAPGATVYLQVNISGESEKGGCEPAAVPHLLDRAAACDLDVQGLMGVASQDSASEVRRQFASLRALVDDLGLVGCSMGMTGDFEIALGEGSTMIRVGTALFGPRPVRERET